MREMLEELLKAIGFLVVAVGGLIGIAYAIFRHLGEKWLDARFDERLAAYKHEQQKELEQVRYKITALLDRATKLHQREFEVLPEAWSLLNDAFWKINSFVSPLQQYPDLNRMSDPELDEFVKACALDQWEKEEIRSTPDRNRYYAKRIFWHRLADVRLAASTSHVFLLKHAIFLSSGMKDKFVAVDALVWEALEEHEANETYDIKPREREKTNALRQNGPGLLKALEADVHGRLWNSETLAL